MIIILRTAQETNQHSLHTVPPETPLIPQLGVPAAPEGLPVLDIKNEQNFQEMYAIRKQVILRGLNFGPCMSMFHKRSESFTTYVSKGSGVTRRT